MKKMIDSSITEQQGLIITKLKNNQLLETANSLPNSGVLFQNSNGYTYLKISEDYLNTLFPLLKDETFNKNELFLNDRPLLKSDTYSSHEDIGAHISLIYPNEKLLVPKLKEIGQTYIFKIIDLCKIQFANLIKTYFCIVIESEKLLSLRPLYGFSEELNFHGYKIFPHITIAIQINDKNK